MALDSIPLVVFRKWELGHPVQLIIHQCDFHLECQAVCFKVIAAYSLFLGPEEYTNEENQH